MAAVGYNLGLHPASVDASLSSIYPIGTIGADYQANISQYFLSSAGSLFWQSNGQAPEPVVLPNGVEGFVGTFLWNAPVLPLNPQDGGPRANYIFLQIAVDTNGGIWGISGNSLTPTFTQIGTSKVTRPIAAFSLVYTAGGAPVSAQSYQSINPSTGYNAALSGIAFVSATEMSYAGIITGRNGAASVLSLFQSGTAVVATDALLTLKATNIGNSLTDAELAALNAAPITEDLFLAYGA